MKKFKTKEPSITDRTEAKNNAHHLIKLSYNTGTTKLQGWKKYKDDVLLESEPH